MSVSAIALMQPTGGTITYVQIQKELANLMKRELTDEEIQWFADTPLGESHSITGNENLAACESCGWMGQADTMDYLMEQITDHLEDTYRPLTPSQEKNRRGDFTSKFGWDPWAEGVVDETTQTRVYDMMEIHEVGPDGDTYEEMYHLIMPDGDSDMGYDDDYDDDDDEESGWDSPSQW